MVITPTITCPRIRLFKHALSAILWTSTGVWVEMRHAGERERRTSYSDVLRSHRAGTARSTGGHCDDAGGPIGGQTTLYVSEGSSGECAILSARIGTQPVRFNIADALDPDGDIPAESEPVAAYLTSLADVTGGTVGNMGFTAARLRIV